MYTIQLLEPCSTLSTTLTISPLKHEYQIFKPTDGSVVATDIHRKVMAFFPPPPIPTTQFQWNGGPVLVTDYRENVMELQLFYDPRIPGWEIATKLGGIGGGEIFSSEENEQHCGKTVRQVFCLGFSSSQISPSSRSSLLQPLPITLSLPKEYVYLLQMSLASPTKLFLIDIFSISSKNTIFSYLEPGFPATLLEQCTLRQMLPFEIVEYIQINEKAQIWNRRRVGGEKSVVGGRFIVRSPSQCTIVQHPHDFAQNILKEVPRKLLFRFLCLQSENCVKEYVQLFPKHKKTFRLCHYAISNWIRQLHQSYYNVNVVKTQTLHETNSFAPWVKKLHDEVYRKTLTPITFDIVKHWFYKQPAEDALYCLLPYL